MPRPPIAGGRGYSLSHLAKRRRRSVTTFCTAIDDCTRLRVLRAYPRNDQKIAIQFIDHVLSKLPFQVEKVHTDNGQEFGLGVSLAPARHGHRARQDPTPNPTPERQSRALASASIPRSSTDCSKVKSSTIRTSSPNDSNNGKTTTTTIDPTALSRVKHPTNASSKKHETRCHKPLSVAQLS